MPGVADMTVKISADISDALSKVDTIKAKINQLTENQGALKDEIKNLNFSLRDNEKEYAKVAVALDKVNTSTAEGKLEAAALRKELSTLGSNNIQITKALKDNQKAYSDTTAQIKIHASELKKAESGGLSFAKGATKVYSGLRKIAYVIPGLGIAGLISIISGPLIDAFADWFDAIDKVSEAQQLLQANLKNYNDINSEANKNAGKQIADLKILYQAATNVNLSMKDRLAAVKGLQNEFPSYFKNINQETILNGGAKSAYDQLTESIIRNARAKAANEKLQTIEGQLLDNENQKRKILNATTNEAAKAQDRILQSQTTGSSFTGGGAGGQTVTITREEQLKIIEARRDAALKIVEINNQSLKDQEDFIVKYIGLSNLAAGVETELKPPKTKKAKKEVETITDVLKKLAIQIDFLNQKEIVLKTSQSNQKIAAIESTIDTLMQKFKLLADNPIIVNLQGKINDIQLTDQFKKVLNDKSKIPIPVEFQAQAPDVTLGPGWADEQVLRNQLLAELKKRGITKTAPIQIGVDMIGNPQFTKSQFITSATGTKELVATLDAANNKLKEMSQLTIDVLSPAFDALFTGILSGSQDAFNGFGQALERMIVQLGAAVLKAAALAAIISLINPFATGVPGKSGFNSIFKKLLGFKEGGEVKGFATGGIIQGPGTGKSDSIIARVSRGEYIIKEDIVKKYGVGFFDRINYGHVNIKELLRDKTGMMKFATGGLVSPNIINTYQRQLAPSIGIAAGQAIEVYGNFELRNDKLVAAVNRGNARISRNS